MSTQGIPSLRLPTLASGQAIPLAGAQMESRKSQAGAFLLTHHEQQLWTHRPSTAAQGMLSSPFPKGTSAAHLLPGLSFGRSSENGALNRGLASQLGSRSNSVSNAIGASAGAVAGGASAESAPKRQPSQSGATRTSSTQLVASLFGDLVEGGLLEPDSVAASSNGLRRSTTLARAAAGAGHHPRSPRGHTSSSHARLPHGEGSDVIKGTASWGSANGSLSATSVSFSRASADMTGSVPSSAAPVAAAMLRRSISPSHHHPLTPGSPGGFLMQHPHDNQHGSPSGGHNSTSSPALGTRSGGMRSIVELARELGMSGVGPRPPTSSSPLHPSSPLLQSSGPSMNLGGMSPVRTRVSGSGPSPFSAAAPDSPRRKSMRRVTVTDVPAAPSASSFAATGLGRSLSRLQSVASVQGSEVHDWPGPSSPPARSLSRSKSRNSTHVVPLTQPEAAGADAGRPQTVDPASSAGSTGSIRDLLHGPSVRMVLNMMLEQQSKVRSGGMASSSSSGPDASTAGSNGRGSATMAVTEPGIHLHRVYHTGVSMKFLLRFDELLPRGPLTSEQVAKEHIIPATERLRAKMVDLIAPQSVNLPRLYVCHAWSADFHELVDGLRKYCSDHGLDPATTYIFLDLMCCNLHQPVVTERDLGTLKEVVSSCKHVLLCVDSQATVFSRLWCILEIWMAATLPVGGARIKTNDRLRVLLYSAEQHSLHDAITALHPARARASVREEEEMIKALLLQDNDFGVARLEEMQDGMREALLTSARQEVAAAERSQSNNPRRGAVALLKSVYLSAAQGKDWDAEKALRQVLQIAAGTEGGLLSELEHARLLASLAVIMARREFKGEADRLAAEALDVLEPWYEGWVFSSASSTSNSSTTTTSSSGIVSVTPAELIQGLLQCLVVAGLAAHERKDKAQAEQAYQRVLSLHQQARCPKAGTVREAVDAYCHLSTLAAESGKPKAAERHLRDALILCETSLDDGHPLTQAVRYKLADALHELAADEQHTARAAAAAGPDPRALSRQQSMAANQAFGRKSMEGTSFARGSREAAGRGGSVSWLRESETLLGQVERALADMFGPSHPGALSARALLGHVLLTGGFITQAEKVLVELHSSTEHVYGTSHPISKVARSALTRLRDHYQTVAQQARNVMDDGRAEEALRKALRINQLVWSEEEEHNICRELNEVLRRQNKPLEPAAKLSVTLGPRA